MKLKKIFCVFSVVLAAIVLSVYSVSAETYFVTDTLTYSIYDNQSLTLEDWNTDVNSVLSLPDEIDGRSFVNIANWAFENNTELKGIDLLSAKHLKRIGYESFMGCSAMSGRIDIPQSVTVLGERAFCECSSVLHVIIEGNVNAIPTECFYGCSSALSVTLPLSLEKIEAWAFGNCTALQYVAIPDSVTSIAPTAFKNDPNLTLGVFYNSAGYTYAKDNHFNYVLLDYVMMGDANGDGNVDIRDATTIQRHIADIDTLSDISMIAADVNHDNRVTVDDATFIQRYVAGYRDVVRNRTTTTPLSKLKNS